jgi:uncharacterized lipoprotein NlpE involved in copper resistance
MSKLKLSIFTAVAAALVLVSCDGKKPASTTEAKADVKTEKHEEAKAAPHAEAKEAKHAEAKEAKHEEAKPEADAAATK